MRAKRPVLRWIEENKDSVTKLECHGGYTVLHYEDNTKEIISYPNKSILPLLGEMIYIRRTVYIKKELLNTNELSRRLKRKYKNEKSIITNINAVCV